MEKKQKLRFFYDGHCPICARQTDKYRSADQSETMEFIDIRSEDFDGQQLGLDPVEVNRSMHAIHPTLGIVKGIDSLSLIWKSLNIHPVLRWFIQFPLSRPFMHMGYALFADHIRPLISRNSCENSKCDIHKKDS